MSRKRATPRRPPARPRRATSTALARRKPAAVATRSRVEVLPVANGDGDRVLQDGISLGALGLIELKLTPAEDKILNEPVDWSRVRYRPRKKDGPADVPYLPHQDYTRWFNRAFGRTGWALVPVGKPTITQGSKAQTITCPYILHIHGKPVAFAIGEQEYYESNEQQTYGDALESTVASALRRCAKRLGVGLELWDKQQARGAPSGRGREGGPTPPRSTTQPGPAPRPETRREPAREEPVSHDARSNEPITQKQRQRLWVIIRNSGRSEDEVRRWLVEYFRWTSTKDVSRRDYDFVCRMIESNGDLPMPRDREPGGEG